jgi:Mrp family chromosome partitioning ATPase/capsular polysaccharide biosynthesis protein
LKRLFARIKPYSWIVLACVLVATAGGYLLAKAQPTVYQANSVLIVQSGAPGTTWSGTSSTVSSADSLTKALSYAAQISTRPVMQFIIQFDPRLQLRGYTADDLIADVIPSTATTVATITLTVSTTHQADAVLLANSVAQGFSAYIQSQTQQQLDTMRKNLTDQISNYQQQKLGWETKLESLPNNQVPQYTVYNNNLTDITHTIDTLQAQLQLLPVTVKSDVNPFQFAEPKDVTTSSKPTIIIAVTAGVGLFIGVLVMLLVIFLDNRLFSYEQVKEQLGLAYLGGISNTKGTKTNLAHITGRAADEVEDICANLRLTGVLPGSWQAPMGAVLLITSPRTAEGKTNFAALLSSILARYGKNVVVVDGNLREPSTHLAFGMKAVGLGLNGLLKSAGAERVNEVVVRSNIPGVWLLPVGAPVDSGTLLVEQKLPGILNQLRAKSDVIIIDGPSLFSGATASLLATMVDGIVLVVDARHERLPILMQARDMLDSLVSKPAGVIMNRVVGTSKGHYYAVPGNSTFVNRVPAQVPLTNGNGLKNVPGPSLEEIKSPSSPQQPPNVYLPGHRLLPGRREG